MSMKIPAYSGLVIGGPLDGQMHAELKSKFTIAAHKGGFTHGAVVGSLLDTEALEIEHFHYRFSFIASGENDPINFWHLADTPAYEALAKVFMYYHEGEHNDGA